ncbi:MAG: orotidine-5'-phosphate decarboxylase [Calditrichaeota bacterium]|nr:orotidine-5'-phosphate decarboxylase [Calditrichota bacterium]
MNFNKKLDQICQGKNSLVCVGIDVDLEKVPPFIAREKNALVKFSKVIIDATLPFAAAYKINTAFFEAYGAEGWKAMAEIAEYLPDDVIKVADAKRGDIGNTSRRYARAFFEKLPFDAITVSPYLGFDSVAPFLEQKEKGAFVLCHTTNKGAEDFQRVSDGQNQLYEIVAAKVQSWNALDNCGLVVGATYPEQMREVRALAPELPFLVPGLGAQGGDYELAVSYATDENGRGAIFNASRSILYASSGKDFAERAEEAAREMKEKINSIRENKRGN